MPGFHSLLLNMYEVQISSCATLSPQDFFPRLSPKLSVVVDLALGEQADHGEPWVLILVGGLWPSRDIIYLGD